MQHEEALRIAESTPNRLKPTEPAAWLGRWTNQMGSTMDLEIQNGEVNGTYTSKTSGQEGGGSVASNSMKGYVHGDLISFVVLWPGGSMTAWTGQLVNDKKKPCIKTLWHLVTEVPDIEEADRLWTSTLAGADDFYR